MSIEDKIAKILAEGRVNEEEAKVPAYSQNPDNARNNVDRQTIATGGTSKKANRVTKDAAAPEASCLKGSMKEGLDALVNGENLSEEFKEKAATIFEAAVLSRVAEEIEALDEEYAQLFEQQLQEAVEQQMGALVDHIDGYLNYVVEQWMEENELAIERGVKSDMMESFINGLKGLFEQNYIELPESELDLVDELADQIDELEAKLSEEVDANIALSAALTESIRFDIVSNYTDGLVQTEVDKFVALTEEIAFESAEIFEDKVATIRENFFNTKSSKSLTESMYQSVEDTSSSFLSEEVNDNMSAYVNALNRSVKQ